jgi:cardiolipin synthase C
VFIGSMNYDQRSRRLNTEDGAIIHSSELAAQSLRRFDAMTQAQNAYAVVLQPKPPGGKPRLEWNTAEGGRPVTYRREPARSPWQRLEVGFLALFPLDREL